MAGNRIQDHRAEQELTKYLDINIYPTITKYYRKVYNNYNVVGVRVTNKDDQIHGIDYKFVISNNETTFNICIDEKSQLYYMKNPLQTFAFEINSLQRGFTSPGWLFDNSLLTDIYMLIYPKSNSPISSISFNDFHDVECYLIRKNDLINYLNRRGFSHDLCLKMATDIRNNQANYIKDDGSRYKYSIDDSYHTTISDIYFTYSYHLLEHPINLIINKKDLIDMSFFKIKK